MLEQNDIYIGRPLIYGYGKKSWHAIVTEMADEGFFMCCCDGDRLFVWYKYDMKKVKPLEIK